MVCDVFVILANRLIKGRVAGINSARDLLINYVFDDILNVYCIHDYYSYCMNVTVMNRPMVRTSLCVRLPYVEWFPCLDTPFISGVPRNFVRGGEGGGFNIFS